MEMWSTSRNIQGSTVEAMITYALVSYYSKPQEHSDKYKTDIIFISVEETIASALIKYYHQLPEPRYTKKQEKFMKQKEIEEQKNIGSIDYLIKYGMTMKKEKDNGIYPGYYRRLKDYSEVLTALIFNNSREFREATNYVAHCLTPTGKKLYRMQLKRDNEYNQHPEIHEKWTPDLGDLEQWKKRGRTYARTIHLEYGGIEGFANKTWFGNCKRCSRRIPVWRSCPFCAMRYFLDLGENIFTISFECELLGHQYELDLEKYCARCDHRGDIIVRFQRLFYDSNI